MNPSLSERWAATVLKRRVFILLGWLAATIAIRMLAPTWNEIAFDGDFEYLPAEMNSVAGGKLLDEAFPEVRPRFSLIQSFIWRFDFPTIMLSNHTQPSGK